MREWKSETLVEIVVDDEDGEDRPGSFQVINDTGAMALFAADTAPRMAVANSR
jgi:hypothetical protein